MLARAALPRSGDVVLCGITGGSSALMTLPCDGLTLADVQSYLRSKDRHATGICRVAQTASPSAGWETAGISVASIIAEPTKGKLHVAASNDPGNAFVEYAMS